MKQRLAHLALVLAATTSSLMGLGAAQASSAPASHGGVLHSSAEPPTAEPARTEAGYIPLPDGTELKYTALLPEGKGPFPVLMQYEGYYAGSDPTRANTVFVPRMLAKGYAVVGVSLRGSGCSSGVWELFNRQQARDGAFAVDWLATQPWANGKVAMYSYSYGGIMQAWVAAERPEHLVAITPANIVADTYRDIGFPGGIYNQVFPPQWGAALNLDWTIAMRSDPTDLKCATNVAQHYLTNNFNQLAVQAPQHPYWDGWHVEHSIAPRAGRIDVPALVVQSWQDEQTGGRGGHFFEEMDPRKTWLISTNGSHTLYGFSEAMLSTLTRFYDYHLKGIRNGFGRTPRVQVWHETRASDGTPRSVTMKRRLPVRVKATKFFLGPDASLARRPSATDAPASFAYPVPSPAVVDTSALGYEGDLPASTWAASTYDPLGRAVFTSAPLSRTLTTWGSASADLWVSTTAPDTDLQVTLTEVRPDGQEVYVQRGWLRASHRALDARRSTTLRPWHPHTEAVAEPMSAGIPELLRVEVMPFGHTFRAGSSVRMYVEFPSVTGLWGFAADPTPQQVTVHQGRDHPSRLVLGAMSGAKVARTLPACGEIHSQGCRTNLLEPPGGRFRLGRD